MQRLIGTCICFVVAGCGLTKDPPTQLEADLSTEYQFVEPKDRETLARRIVQHLDVEGLRPEQVRVIENQDSSAYLFRVVDKLPIPSEQLELIAARLGSFAKDMTWSATLTVVDPSEKLDGFLATKEREFPMTLSWRSATVSAYVVRYPDSMFSAAPLDGGTDQQRIVLCMLAFDPGVSLPPLHGTREEIYGPPENDTPAAALRRKYSGGGMTMEIPHEVSFVDSLLEAAFNEPPIVKDGRLMFQFAELLRSGIFDAGADSQISPTDFGGRAQAECQSELAEKHEAVAKQLARADVIVGIKEFGPAKIMPLSKS